MKHKNNARRFGKFLRNFLKELKSEFKLFYFNRRVYIQKSFRKKVLNSIADFRTLLCYIGKVKSVYMIDLLRTSTNRFSIYDTKYLFGVQNVVSTHE